MGYQSLLIQASLVWLKLIRVQEVSRKKEERFWISSSSG